MSIRTIDESVWTGILRVQEEAYADVFPESLEVLKSKWHTSPSTCFVYVDNNGELLGYLLSHPWPSSSAPKLHEEITFHAASDNLYLHDLAVSDKARGKGAAQQLVNALLQSAHTLGHKTISLVAVQGAGKFWSKYGFARVTEMPLPDSYGHDAQFMRMQLS
jgi:predicted N-acetyltransferase YhbS